MDTRFVVLCGRIERVVPGNVELRSVFVGGTADSYDEAEQIARCRAKSGSRGVVIADRPSHGRRPVPGHPRRDRAIRRARGTTARMQMDNGWQSQLVDLTGRRIGGGRVVRYVE